MEKTNGKNKARIRLPVRVFRIFLLLVFILAVAGIAAVLLSKGTDVRGFRGNIGKQSEDRLVNPVDWDRLAKINPDIYAWIELPGTFVDYPVLQSAKKEPEDFYLHRNLYKQYSFAGSVYSRRDNKKDFNDYLTVLHGHNMMNGSMFGTLGRFENADFFDRHKRAYVYMLDRIFVYEIVSCSRRDDKCLTVCFPPDREHSEKFLSMLWKGNVRNGIDISSSDRILSLSTCCGLYGQRRIVFCRLDKVWDCDKKGRATEVFWSREGEKDIDESE